MFDFASSPFANRARTAAFRSWSSASRTYSSWRTSPSVGQKVAGVLTLLVLIGLAIMIIVPALLIGAAVVIVGALGWQARQLWLRLTGPKSEKSLRRNVRVRGQDSPFRF